jgi:hypothetical protein
MFVNGEPLRPDELLLAMNDRRGSEVEVMVQTEIGDAPAMVMTARGTLRHWRDDSRAMLQWAGFPREDLAGLYYVGDASFDVTDLGAGWFLADEGEEPHGLGFKLAESVTLTVVWGADDR